MEATTLEEAIVFFADEKNCRKWITPRRWPNGVKCPRCGSQKVSLLEKYSRWQCGARHASRQFTVKTGTIFEDSPVGLNKWLIVMWQVVNDYRGVSSYEVHRMIGVSQKTAWFLDHRIRHALTSGSTDRLRGTVQSDKGFIGRKARNMHKELKPLKITGTGGTDRTMFAGILGRAKDGTSSKIRTKVIDSVFSINAMDVANPRAPRRDTIPMGGHNLPRPNYNDQLHTY